MLRSTTGDTTLVNTRLNAGRAMMLCCSANSASNAASISSAVCHGPSAGESIDFGTPKLPTKPMAYRNVAKKIA